MLKRVVIMLLFNSILLCGIAAAKEFRLAIMPFKVNTQDDIAYIRDGITSILPSRIAVNGKISIIDSYLIYTEFKKLPADHPRADEIAIGKKFKADFILIGSITKIGANVSLDTRLIDVASPEDATPFFIQSIGLNDMLPQLTALSDQVRKRILEEMETIKAEPSPALPEAKKSSSGLPERKVTTAEAPVDASAEESLENQETTVVQPRAEKKPPLFEATPSYSTTISGDTINCMAAGDTDGDGNKELLLSGEYRILIYQWKEGGLQLRNEIKAGQNEHIVHIDTGDTNRNGKDEIFVSSFGTHMPNSFVLEFQDSAYKSIESSQEWFFRTYQPPGKRLTILGQKAGEVNPFANAIFSFAWKNGKLLSRTEFLIPESLQLYSFVEADLDGDNRLEYIAFNRGIVSFQYQLTIFSSLGRIRWQDTQQLGGSMNYFRKLMFNNDIEQKDYLPMRILCDDYNRDGRLDVIVGKNLRKNALTEYDRGEVLCLHWDGYDLTTNWSSGILNGYVTDYGVFDLDNDGKMELYIISVTEKGFLGKEKNHLTVFKQAVQ